MSTKKKNVSETFFTDVKNHKMTVELDQGVHRCLMFASPGTGVCHFRLTTWRGHLAVTGDMGDFIFERLEDMFVFFRNKPINETYYAEKCQAGHTDEFRPDLWPSLLAYLVEAEAIDEATAARMEDEPATVDEAYHMLDEADVRDAEEYVAHLYDYTEHFIWCLHAIKWGIEQYDAYHAAKGEQQCET